MAQTAVMGYVFPSADRNTRQLSGLEGGEERSETLGVTNTNLLKRRLESIQRFEAFSGITAPDCAVIIADATEKRYNRHSAIFAEGDPAREIVLLLSGCVKISQSGAHGQEVILRIHGPGDLLGQVGERAKSRHLYTAHALQISTVLVWDVQTFEAALRRFPLLRRNIVNALERQLSDLEVRFREVSTEKVGARLSNLLVRLMSQLGKRADGHMEIALSRRDLAQLTGTTLFTVSRMLCKWETMGIVSARRETVLVHNVSALLELSREE